MTNKIWMAVVSLAVLAASANPAVAMASETSAPEPIGTAPAKAGAPGSSGLKIAGVSVPDSVTATDEGLKLKLNGAGIRKVYFIKAKVYVGALYLETPETDPEVIINSDQAKSVHMTFLRDVPKEKILKAFKEGFEKNSAGAFEHLSAQLDAIADSIPDLKEGSEMVATYVPGKGTTIGVTGGGAATVPGKEFGQAIFRNWLGSEPADADLKAKMLGGK